MKNLKNLVVLGVLAIGLQTGKAVLYSSGLISVNQDISDGNATGISTTFNVSSDIWSISEINLTLNISGGYAGDLYAYLTHDGYTAILLNRIGTTGAGSFGNSSPGMNVTLSSSAFNNIHDAASGVSALNGTFGADGRDANPMNLAAVYGASPSRTLSEFLSHGAGGDWTLFISDVDGGAVSHLDSWGMEITGVPEPTNIALGVFGGGFAVVQGFRFWQRKKASGNF